MTRQRKPNPKYANIAVVMEEKEHITYEDASQKDQSNFKVSEFCKQLKVQRRTNVEGEK